MRGIKTQRKQITDTIRDLITANFRVETMLVKAKVTTVQMAKTLQDLSHQLDRLQSLSGSYHDSHETQ